MTARVIPIAVSGDPATPLPIDRECGCSPLDGCCLPPRPKLVTTTEEQQDNPAADTVSDDAGTVEYQRFELANLTELFWFNQFLDDSRKHEPERDFYVAIDDALRLVAYHREFVQALADARQEINDLEEAGDIDGVNEIIEEVYPVEEYPEIEVLATNDARGFFATLINLHTDNPLLDTREAVRLALDVIYGKPDEVPEEVAEETVRFPMPEDFDLEVDDEGDLCDCLPGECLGGWSDEDPNEDLTHLAEIAYVFADGAKFTIAEPLYRFILDDGTHCIEGYDIGYEIPPGFIAVVCHPVDEADVVLQHHADGE